MSCVAWLHRGALPRELAGGKGASLSQLFANGFEVPLGFVVTAEGYRLFELASGLRELIEDMAGAEPAHAAERLQRAVMAADLPAHVKLAVGNAYAELTSAAGEACAVRSSAVSEDSDKASFAGLYDSYLNLRGLPAVLDAVRRCYASLWSERAFSYRALQSPVSEGEAMAVVIMSLVPAEASGIAFSVHPVTGARDQVVINSSFGLGEAVVSGRVTPDSFVVQKGSLRLTERDIYPKTFAIYPHPDVSGTVEQQLPPARASEASIRDDQAQTVAGLAVRAEERFGAPQDIEWGLAGGRIYLLQARPVTTLF